MKVLGVNPAAGKLWLCLVDGERAIASEPDFLELHDGIEAGYGITAFRGESERALTAVRPDRVVLLDMESSAKLTTATLRGRFTAEALLAAAAADAGITCTRLPRPTLRARLDLPRSGKLVDHVTAVFATPVGENWKTKRDLAALAARAEIVGE